MNDWIVANINNSDFTVSDFHDIADMDVNNTQMLSKDKYLKSDYIKNNPLFQKDGKFSEDLFDKFYKQKLSEYQKFQEGDYFSGPALDMFDTRRTTKTPVKDNQFLIGRIIPNPERQQIGIEGVSVFSKPTKSRAEIAQENKIYDYEKGEYRDYSPNDKALFNGKHDYGMGFISQLWEDPLVMAQYSKDGEHRDPISGQMVKHKKGDYKLNEKGTYYYETLGNRSPIGKQVLSIMDTITVDGTGINTYDFFDSDDIEKSIQGVIAKNVVSLLPMFAGGPISTAYSLALVSREMAKSLPMVYGVASAFFTDDDTPKWINSIAATGEKLTSGTSDYSKQHTFSFENFGNMIADVALQWGQQKFIAKGMDKLRGTKNYMKEAEKKAKALYDAKKATMGAQAALEDANWKASALGQAALKKYMPEAEKATKVAGALGRDASLAYMAIISNTDVYADMLAHGASKQEAAAVALGSTLGMYAVDKTGLGEVFFDGATEESVKQARRALRKEFEEARKTAFKGIDNSNISPAQRLMKYIKKGSEAGKKVMGNFIEDLRYHTTNLGQKMVAEGLEEVSEEAVADVAKSIYELAGKLGADTQSLNVGAWDNAFERYSMNFLGGAIGGGVFYGKEVWDRGTFSINKKDEELATLIRNGHINDLRDVLTDMKKHGKVGSTKISGIEYESDDKGNNVWLSASSRETSQNDVIADLIGDKITALDAVINNNQVNLDDDALFRQMVLSENRFAKYQDISKITNYYQDFNDVLMNLIKAEAQYKKAAVSLDGTPDGEIGTDEQLRHMTDEQKAIRQANIEKYVNELQTARDKKNEFLSGDNSLDYSRKLNFLMDPMLHDQFIAIDEAQLWQEKFGDKTKDDISIEDMVEFLTELQKKRKEQLKSQGTDAFDRFKKLEKVLIPHLQILAENTDKFKQWQDSFLKELESGSLNPANIEKWDKDIQLDGEDDNTFAHRDTPYEIDPLTGEAETPEDFIKRKKAREQIIAEHNLQVQSDWAQAVKDKINEVGGTVDPFTYHMLLGPNSIINTRAIDMIRENVKNNIGDTKVVAILDRLNLDLSNSQELIKEIRDSQKQTQLDEIMKFSEKVKSSTLDTEEGESVNLFDLFDENSEITLDEIIADIKNDELDTGVYTLTAESQQFLLNIVQYYKERFGGQVELLELLRTQPLHQIVTGEDTPNDAATVAFDNYVNMQQTSLENNINNILRMIQSNPIFQLVSSLQGTLHNPVVDLVQSLVGKTLDKIEVPDVMNTLDMLMNDFQTIDNISDIVLDEKQRDILERTKDALKMINTYIYAASANSDMSKPIGHNKIFNEMARNHSDLVTKWEELPEIDDDYATLYLREISKYSNVLQNWINFANNNTINKRGQFIRSDQAFNKSLWDYMYDLYQNSAFSIEISDRDGKKVKRNLLDGFSSIDDTLKDKDKVGVPLFHAEKLLYTNFQKTLKESGLSVTEFLEQTGLFDKLIADGIAEQKTARITDKLTKKDLSTYDKLQYITSILTLDPVSFYTNLKAKVRANDKLAPITAQEYGQKLVLANRHQQFRDIMGYVYKKSGDSRYAALNTVVITGAAGAGKTQAVAKVATDGIASEDILALGPTNTQAKSLRDSLGIVAKTGMPNTIEEFAKAILGEATYNELIAEINSAVSTKKGTQHKFFRAYSVNGFYQPTLNVDKDNNLYKIKADGTKKIIKFNKLPIIPKLIAIDEATHIPAPLAQIFDLYQRQNNGQLLLIGDPKQNGFLNSKNGMGNIESSRFFSVRAPELDVSLRDNNIQKQYNLSVIKALLDTIQDKMEGSEEDLAAFWPTALNILSKIKFKVYNKEEINGDLIVPTLDEFLLKKIANKKGKIGFIGDKSSATYSQLVKSGLVDGTDFQTLNYEQMQGQEFDYVIVDKDFTKPGMDIGIRNTVKDIYTLMSRGREAAIFIDKGISSLVGQNEISDYKAKAPSLQDVIDGKSAVQELREKKLEVLSMYDLTPTGIESEEENKKKEETKKKIDSEATFMEDSKDNPDERSEEVTKTGKKLSEVIAEMDKESRQNLEPELEEIINGYSEFSAPTYGDVTYLSVSEVVPTEKEGIDFKAPLLPNGEHSKKIYKGDKWIIRKPVDGPLRNLQALIDGDEAEIFWYESIGSELSKMKLQRELQQLKSAVIFDHSYDDLAKINSKLAKRFKKEDWEAGKVKLEIREANETLPIFASMQEVGMEYNGKRYIADLVYEVKNKDGKTVLIDLAGINNPNTLLSNVDIIKSNIEAKLASGKITDPAVKSKLQNIYDTIKDRAIKYQSWIEDRLKDYEAADKSTPFLIEVEDALDYSKTTWFKKRKEVTRPDGTKEKATIRLGGTVNPTLLRGGENEAQIREDAIKADKNINFRTLNPHIVISDVYTYSSKRDTLESLDPSVKGKAVVFISSDTLLKPDELIQEYIEQKKHPFEHKPRVRMLVLKNYGMTFSQFANPDFIKTFQGGDEERKPIRQNFKGIQMFTSLWNARASLIQFNKAVDKWISENGYNSEKLQKILKADQDIFDAKKAVESSGVTVDINAILNDNGVTQEEYQTLTNLNEEILKDIPMFRLGYQKTSQGFHIQKMNVKGSKAYTEDKVHLVSISKSKAETFQKLLDDTLSALTKNATKPSLGLAFKHEDGSDWGEEELIDLNNDKHRRSLSGLLKFDKDTGITIRIKDEEASREKGSDIYKEIKYDGGDAWSYVPGFLIHMVRRFTALQREQNPSDLTFATTYKYNEGEKTTEELATLQVGLWLGKTIAPTTFDADGKVVEYDHTLLDIFDLIFHGTTEDIHSVDASGKAPLRAKDARFKLGFFIDPDAARVYNDTKTDMVTIPVGDENDEAIFMKIGTAEALFEVDVDPRAAGISLNIDRLLGYKSTSTIEEEKTVETKEEEFARLHPDTAAILKELKKEIGIINDATEDSLETAKDYLNSTNTAAAIDDFAKGINKDLDTLTYYTVEGQELVKHTLQDYFQSLLKSEPFNKAEAVKGEIFINDKWVLKSGKLEIKEKPEEPKLPDPDIIELIWSSDEKNIIREHINALYNEEKLSEDTVNKITVILDNDNGDDATREKMNNYLENLDFEELGNINGDILNLMIKC